MQKCEENFERFTIGCRVPQHETKIKDSSRSRPVVSEKKGKRWENFEALQLAAECHSINKNQRFDQDQTSSSWEKCKKVKKILKLYNWL